MDDEAGAVRYPSEKAGLPRGLGQSSKRKTARDAYRKGTSKLGDPGNGGRGGTCSEEQKLRPESNGGDVDLRRYRGGWQKGVGSS